MIHTRIWMSALWPALLTLLSCTSSDPVATRPLTGVVSGRAFEVKTANVVLDAAPSKIATVTVSDVDLPCRGAEPAGARKVVARFEWTPGFVAPDLDDNKGQVDFIEVGSIGNKGLAAVDGRIEYPSVPAGSPVLVRIRAKADANNNVDGEVRVRSCQ